MTRQVATTPTPPDPSQFQTFNPFTDPTVQGVHFDLGPNFATAQNDLSYQTPRTFRFSVGLRF